MVSQLLSVASRKVRAKRQSRCSADGHL